MTHRGYATSSVTWQFDFPQSISYWSSFGTKPLSLTVSEIFNVECNAMVDMTSKQRSRSFILVLIDFSYTTSYRLPIVTFARFNCLNYRTIRTWNSLPADVDFTSLNNFRSSLNRTLLIPFCRVLFIWLLTRITL